MNRYEVEERIRNQLLEEAPHVFEIWLDHPDTNRLIREKYRLTEWQMKAYNWDILYNVFVKDIPLITIANEIKGKLKIKDQEIANSIALDTAIHIFSKAKDYFRDTDNLIKSLGGEESYWEKYSPNYWNETVVAETLITPEDKKKAYKRTEKAIAKAEIAVKELEQYNVNDVIPKLYNEIITSLKEAKEKLNSGNCDLFYESGKLTIRVIDDVNKAKEIIIKNENNIKYAKNLEKEISELEPIYTKEKELCKIYDRSIWLAGLFLILIFYNLVFYLFFAIIMGLNLRHEIIIQRTKNSIFDIFEDIFWFIFGIVFAPIRLLMWDETKRNRHDKLSEKEERLRELNVSLQKLIKEINVYR